LLPHDFEPTYWQAAPTDQQWQQPGMTGLPEGAVLHLGGFARYGSARGLRVRPQDGAAFGRSKAVPENA
jgi:hypothetical protein